MGAQQLGTPNNPLLSDLNDNRWTYDRSKKLWTSPGKSSQSHYP
eukprot:gene42213-52338_t